MKRRTGLIFALKALTHEAPQHGAAVVAEGGNFVAADFELVWHVLTEPLGARLDTHTHPHKVV